MKISIYIRPVLGCLIFLSIAPQLLGQDAQISQSPNLVQLEASFQATPFTPQQFEAFSVRGEQKFRDFLDYVSYLSAEEMEPLWKAHVVQQVVALFEKDSVSCLGKSSVTDFLKNPAMLTEEASVLEMELIQLFEKKEEHFVAVLQTDISQKNKEPAQILVELHLLRREKKFGEESISVWEVLLGEVKSF